ncbi:MAG: hypothetical protein PVF68_05500 [Acidobacteriota bacterium]|jgi:hypothetical protein
MMRGEHPLGPDAVEAFYARQRAAILQRLPAAGGTGRRHGLAWLAGLAAAAVLVLSAVSVLLAPPPRSATDWPALFEDVLATEVDLPLPAYGEWGQTVNTASEPATGTLAWLLEEDPAGDAGVPEYLDAYGAWDALVNEENPGTT